jgi:hypothetical protein
MHSMPITRPQPNFSLVREDSCSSAEICTHVSKKQSMSARTKQAPEERRVTFFPQVFVRETIHIHNFSPDELAASWYGKEELDVIKNDMVTVVRLIVSGEYTGDTENLCARGCEFRHKEGARQRQMNKLNGILSVLDEQLRQERRGYIDDIELARVYISANAPCRIAAYSFGKNDEIAVKEIDEKSNVSSAKSETTSPVPKRGLEEKRSSRRFFLPSRK